MYGVRWLTLLMPEVLKSKKRHYYQTLFPHIKQLLLFATLDMDHQQDNSQQKAHAAHDDVGKSQEGILPAQQRSRRQNDLLGSVELADRVG